MEDGPPRHSDSVSAAAQQVPFDEPDFRTVFEKSPVLLSVLDADLTVVASSNAYLEATMRKPSDLYGFNVFDAFPDDPDDSDSTATADLRRSIENAIRTRRPDWMAVQRYPIARPPEEGGGFEVRYWSPVNAPIYDDDGKLLYVVQIAQDITAYVEKTEVDIDGVTAYATGNSIIESELLGRTRDLLDENRILTNAQEAKNEFLSRMSHELRTPLTAISGFAELLSVSGLDEERTEWSRTILKASRHLAQLVNEILDISRIESGDISLSIEPVSVSAALEDAVELMRPMAVRRGIDLSVDGDLMHLYVMADSQRLKQVVINLLSNSIKYNRPDGVVSVEVGGSASRVTLAINDTGNGLRADELRKLFTPFERLSAAENGVEGTGLGLALSKNLVEAMRGSLTVDSIVGVGSTFRIELRRVEPAVAVNDAPDDQLLATRAYSRPSKLIYIEDTVANANLVEQILVRRPSVRVLPAMLGRLGFELATEHQPDMILLDLHLPDMNGADVLALLKSDPQTRNVPVVILSADATGRQYDEVMNAGAREFLTKPIRVNEVLATVDRYLDDE